MKCDELKPLVFSLNELSFIDESAVQKNFENPHDHAVYKATEVDAAIAELKAKLEDAKATAYAESVDAGMRERRLKLALWHARARTAYLEFRLFVNDSVHTADSAEANNAERMAIKWQKVERKCLAMAEKFGG